MTFVFRLNGCICGKWGKYKIRLKNNFDALLLYSSTCKRNTPLCDTFVLVICSFCLFPSVEPVKWLFSFEGRPSLFVSDWPFVSCPFAGSSAGVGRTEADCSQRVFGLFPYRKGKKEDLNIVPIMLKCTSVRPLTDGKYCQTSAGCPPSFNVMLFYTHNGFTLTHLAPHDLQRWQ